MRIQFRVILNQNFRLKTNRNMIYKLQDTAKNWIGIFFHNFLFCEK